MTITGRIALLIIAAALVAIYAVYLWPRVDAHLCDLRQLWREFRARRVYGSHYPRRAR